MATGGPHVMCLDADGAPRGPYVASGAALYVLVALALAKTFFALAHWL